MKKITLFFAILFFTSVASMAQKQVWVLPQHVPQGINYQAAVRDETGNVLANTAVSFRVSILKGATNGPSQYTETHQVTTNAQGLASFVIFRGTHVSGNYGHLTWTQEGPYFLQVEMDKSGGGNYLLMGTSELLSVPYAINADYSLFAYSSGPIYEVGQLAEGGIVIATWDGGRHGWVAGLEDVSKSTTWNDAVRLVQADTTGGYRDWVLPNMAQLNLMYEQRVEIGGFTSTAYWSSHSEFAWESVSGLSSLELLEAADQAYIVLFSIEYGGRENSMHKTYSDSEDPIGVRAVREF